MSDNKLEPLITMDTPEEDTANADYLEKINIPSALISKSLGDSIKSAISDGNMVNMKLDWTESVPHPDERVEYELWTDSNDECGKKCDTQIEFLRNFKGAAQILEKGGYTQFTPHFITWYCPKAFMLSRQCKSQCINHGRYCAPDPEQDFTRGYDGKDVVVQNLRHACVFRVVNETGKAWKWWDYATDFSVRCPMKYNKYTSECADEVIKSLGECNDFISLSDSLPFKLISRFFFFFCVLVLGIDLEKVYLCMGDTEGDVENPVLKAEQESQVGKGSRGDVTILPTLVVNNRQYRGTPQEPY